MKLLTFLLGLYYLVFCYFDILAFCSIGTFSKSRISFDQKEL